MFETLLSVLETGLSLWDHEDSHKYRDKVIDLRRRWNEEKNKADSDRSDAVLDNLEFELRLCAIGFASEARSSDAPAKP